MKWFRRAAEQGHALSQHELGIFYYTEYRARLRASGGVVRKSPANARSAKITVCSTRSSGVARDDAEASRCAATARRSTPKAPNLGILCQWTEPPRRQNRYWKCRTGKRQRKIALVRSTRTWRDGEMTPNRRVRRVDAAQNNLVRYVNGKVTRALTRSAAKFTVLKAQNNLGMARRHFDEEAVRWLHARLSKQGLRLQSAQPRHNADEGLERTSKRWNSQGAEQGNAIAQYLLLRNTPMGST